jgi:hypothetical protein
LRIERVQKKNIHVIIVLIQILNRVLSNENK